MGSKRVEIEAPPAGCKMYYSVLLPPAAVAFVADLVAQFDEEVDVMLRRRIQRKLQLDASGELPDFLEETVGVREGSWTVRPLPPRLACRHLDLGDVSPANSEHFVKALKSTAQGIQTDFDDGHCPSWSNQLKGLYNVYAAVHGNIPGVGAIEKLPVILMRPRAWNMMEHNMLVNGKGVPGALFDFALLMYHNAGHLMATGSGPFFYLPKLEGHLEARLWNQIFVWTQAQLGLPVGTIKACVLIENILASFEMDEILFEMRDHSLGLNCGIWDYSASFINKFGQRPDFMLPDRSRYVNMQRHFLHSYMQLLIKTCHRRGAHATGGMAPTLLPPADGQLRQQALEKTLSGKQWEIEAGVDGFMVYDVDLVEPMQQMFKRLTTGENQLHVLKTDVSVTATDLLAIPSGGVTRDGLIYNIGVGILFIFAWLEGRGHFYYKGGVEDSATAEISRSQVWQWIRYGALLENEDTLVTRGLVVKLISDFMQTTLTAPDTEFTGEIQQRRLATAADVFQQVVLKRDFPPFLTTYLYEESCFLREH